MKAKLIILATVLVMIAAPAVDSEKNNIQFLNDRARDITGATAANAPGFIVPGGLTGEGQIVAIADSGLDIGRIDDIHPDLKSTPGKMPKVVLLKSWAGRNVPDDPNGHGTHMAATIAGTGAASNGKFRGIAPGASIYFQGILNNSGEPELPANLENLFWPAYSAGARVHVDAWGSAPNVYGTSASQVDEFVRKHPDFLVVFGAGNEGSAKGTLTTQANSKNALAVGASVLPRPALVPGSDDSNAAADFSSRGPTGDGRIKPELLAPASALISARSRLIEGNLPGYPDYTQMQGTSMAAAVAGGASVLVREYFKKYMDMSYSSAALVKTAMIEGARSGPEGPSKEGFGVIDLAGTLIGLKEKTFQVADEVAGVAQGGEAQYTVHVSDSGSIFKATLAWSDASAEPDSTHTLVNDLDLIVRTPDGKVYYGNHFLGKNTPDRTNNVEQVFLPSPVPGDYTVRVVGAEVKKNTVSGSNKNVQDYALAWGQLPVETRVENAGSSQVKMAKGDSFNPALLPVSNLVNDSISAVDAEHIFPGAAVFLTPQRAYLAARLWRATGVSVLKTGEGYAFTEMNPATRLGGYSIATGAGGVTLNKNPVEPGNLQPGFEISAVVNPLDQKIRQVRAAYIECEGVVSAVRSENGEKNLYLAGSDKAYRISKTATYAYEDNYTGAETEDTPFGTGALDELEEVLPGMPVKLHLAPSSGEVQYLAVKRWVVLGTVKDINAAGRELLMQNGSLVKMFPGAPVKRDKLVSDLKMISPGDHVSAVILPDTGDAIGLVAYSSVLYGKAIDFTGTDRALYMQDDSGCYRVFNLPRDAVIYRWGIRVSADAITAGARIRVTTDPEGKELWRLDIAETFHAVSKVASYNGNEKTLKTLDGKEYRVADASRIYKNGYPVLPGDLLPGEEVEIENAIVPGSTGSMLVSANARTGAAPPLLNATALLLQNRMALTGRSGDDTNLYLASDAKVMQKVEVDKSGRFKLSLPLTGKEQNYTLVALDRRTGGVNARDVAVTQGENDVSVSERVAQAVAGARAEIKEDGGSFMPDNSVTRLEAAITLAKVFGWSGINGDFLPINNISDLPDKLRPVLAEERLMGIFQGYPDGSFHPGASLSRAEVAVVMASVMREAGMANIKTCSRPYRDADRIPPWAVVAVGETTSAGLFRARPDGTFAPDDPVSEAELVNILERFMDLCENYFGSQESGVRSQNAPGICYQ